MLGKAPRALLAFIALAVCAGFLVSCATTKGSTLGKVVAAEAGQKKPAPPPESRPEGVTQGLEIVTDPDRVEVWIDGEYRGMTPLVVDTLPKGWHRLLLRKTGYREVSTWVDYEAEHMLYQANLIQVTGFLDLSVAPDDSQVTVGDARVSPGLVELPVGSFPIIVRAFGYRDYRDRIEIREKSVTTVNVSLDPTPFSLSELSVPRRSVNPDNPGVLGAFEVSFSVSGPGSGSVAVYDGESNSVFSHDLPDFATWDQTFLWRPTDPDKGALPDGEYLLVITGKDGVGGRETDKKILLRLDHTLKVAMRSVWSGSSGLLYAPVAEVLPPGEFQVMVLGGATVVGSFFRAPIQISGRTGIEDDVEVDFSAGAIPSSVAFPFAASVSARWGLLPPHGSFGIGSAVETRFSFQYNPATSAVLATDTFANFTGISIAAPLQLSLGPIHLLFAPSAVASFWYPYGPPDTSFAAWLYLRGGLLLDLGEVSAGISASTRTPPLPGTASLFSSPMPVQFGAEAHWLIPGTHFIMSGIAAGEYEGPEDYYMYGGFGLGFLY